MQLHGAELTSPSRQHDEDLADQRESNLETLSDVGTRKQNENNLRIATHTV
jgi:hypothetical protein